MPEHSHEFHLYRVTVHAARETLFATRARLDDKPTLLREAVMERPSVPWGRTHWAISNDVVVGDSGLHFRIWRAGKLLVAQTDTSGNVVEKEVDASPNAHVILDTRLQVCAIARSPKLTPQTDSIARGLARLLTSTQAAKDRFVEVQVTSIKDPQEFLNRLRKAYTVRSLWIEELRPNPFDAKGLNKNLKDAVETLRANKVRAQFSGEKLDPETPEVEELVRATGTAGGNAGARIQETERARGTIGISLENKQAKFRLSLDLDVESGRESLLSHVCAMYRRLRDRNRDD